MKSADLIAAKKAALDAIAASDSIAEVASTIGYTTRTITRWRDDDQVFARQFARRMKARRKQLAYQKEDRTTFDPSRRKPKKGNFRWWRRTYLGRPVFPHQDGFIDAYEDLTNHTVVWLAPTGAGKDTTAGDIVLYETCDNWSLRVAWLMENQDFSVRRVSERLEPYLTDPAVYRRAPVGPETSVPERNLVEDFGPFTWGGGLVYPNGEPVQKNTWTNQKLYFLREAGESEADPNIWASGLQGAIYGARVQLLVISDPFTFENQASPTEREKQRALLESGGTIATRLDGSGRRLILGTRVAEWDNYGSWIDNWTQGARVIQTKEYWNTVYYKYSNGVAVVVTKAIGYNGDGGEQSFWPDNPEFPLDSYLELNGDRYTVTDLSDDQVLELAEKGARRVIGLREKRDDNPDRFEATQNQNPRSDEFILDFSDLLLDHCDDPARTIGQWLPGEDLVLGVDPAQSGGAAWVLWALDRADGTATVVDLFYGEKLGSQGVRQKLVIDPINKYLPRYLCFEVNRESGQLEHPDIADLIRRTATQLIRHKTHFNRSQGDASVGAMSFDMRDQMIRFPAFSHEDRSKLRRLKQHFQSFDASVVTERRSVSGSYGHAPDDLCMAAWIGWHHIRDLRRSMARSGPIQRRRVPRDVAANWARNHQVPVVDEPLSGTMNDGRDINNLMEWSSASHS